MSKRNMYACTACPKCKSAYRFPTMQAHPQHPSSVICDDCNHVEPIDGENYKPWQSSEDDKDYNK